ncbi:MAG: hypothetical protein H0X66_04125 [Verrucomicrobia bacterium]|nr:hypothetical protein [Verrucomicrobiota bacterium]
MSPDETFALIICLVVGAITWIKWYWEASTVAHLSSNVVDRSSLFLTPLLAALVLLGVLKSFAAHDVRDDGQYIMLYMLMGSAWVGLTRSALGFLGLSARDDVIERKNKAAGYAVSGALLGITLCFAGGNIGDGPGWWVVVFTAALATGTFYLLWILLHLFTSLADTVTIERDPAAGVRLAGFFVAIGLILGRAAAGDWVSAEATAEDFVKTGWPVLFVLGAAIPFEKMTLPRTDRPSSETFIYGAMPAALYIVISAVVLFFKGPWA